MCNYLWNHHHDEYAWYVHETDRGVDWHKNWPTDVIVPRSQLPAEVFQPKPRVATHVRYRSDYAFATLKKISAYIDVGTCYSPPFPKTDALCLQHHDPMTTYWPEMHRFENTDWNYDDQQRAILKAHVARHMRFKHCHFVGNYSLDIPI